MQAIVAAFELDERTVARWQRESGTQCKRVHEHVVEAGRVALSQVQADEIRVKAVGAVYWLACALEVKSRLWLGGVISRHRDTGLIQALLGRVRACGAVENILLVTDGLASYKSQALRIFRQPLHTGRVGRPELILPEGVMVARVKKRCQRRRVVEVIREVVVGAQAKVICRVIYSQRSMTALINTAYIRAPQRHPAGKDGSIGAPEPGRSAQAEYARSGNVVGRRHLQSRMGPSLPCRGPYPSDVGGTPG